MDPVTLGALGFVFLILLILLGVHIAFATAVTGFLGIAILRDPTSVAAPVAGSIV